MFFKTLFIGGLAGFITSFFVNWQQYSNVLQPFNGMELLGLTLFFIGYALVFTVVSQTGFFAYLFIHRFGQGFFKSFWPFVQVALIAFALFDIIYFSSNKLTITSKWALVIFIWIVAIFVSWVKMKQTNKTAFIPAMFLMIVITALELSMVLRAGDIDFVILMVIPLVTANAYQLLVLHKVTEVDEEHQRRIEARRKARMEQIKQKQKAKENKNKTKKG